MCSRDADKVAHEVSVDGLCRVRHVDDPLAFLEVGLRTPEGTSAPGSCPPNARAAMAHLLHDIGQAGCVIEVEVGDEDGVDGGPVELVEEGQRGHAREGRVDARITDDGTALVLDDAA